MFVTTRIERTASWGTLAEPKERPSSVTLFAVDRCPATEKLAVMELESPPVPSTPGCSVAMATGSEASIGRRVS